MNPSSQKAVRMTERVCAQGRISPRRICEAAAYISCANRNRGRESLASGNPHEQHRCRWQARGLWLVASHGSGEADPYLPRSSSRRYLTAGHVNHGYRIPGDKPIMAVFQPRCAQRHERGNRHLRGACR